MSGDSDYPNPATVAEQLACNRQECTSPEECWTSGGCKRRYRPDPKGEPRIRDTAAMRRKLVKDGECRVPDCGDRADDPHHIVYRSDGGDDVEDNIVGLCRLHHDLLHFSAGEEYWETREGIGQALTDAEIRYVIRKQGIDQGADYLVRNYRVKLGRIAEATVKG